MTLRLTASRSAPNNTAWASTMHSVCVREAALNRARLSLRRTAFAGVERRPELPAGRRARVLALQSQLAPLKRSPCPVDIAIGEIALAKPDAPAADGRNRRELSIRRARGRPEAVLTAVHQTDTDRRARPSSWRARRRGFRGSLRRQDRPRKDSPQDCCPHRTGVRSGTDHRPRQGPADALSAPWHGVDHFAQGPVDARRADGAAPSS
jgi:hypothetical protein